MTLDTPKNVNYCASVMKLKSIIPLENCDNVCATPLLGFQAIVSKQAKIGDLGIVFPVETQLSEQFCKQNNLFRHPEANQDPNQKGYIEDNRRVRAVKFRGHRSDCLFMSLESLKFTGIDVSDLKEGDEFDTLNGIEICKKYEVARKSFNSSQRPEDKTFKRVDKKYMPEHLDSENFFKFADTLKPDTEVIITQKLHGTSIRIGHTIVRRKLGVIEGLLKRLGVKIQEYEFDYVFGSRKVVKDINNPHQKHFYDGFDIWTHEGKKLEGLIPQNYLVFAEIIGWTPTSAPIQKSYTYQIPEGRCELYVYRVAWVNEQGLVTDLAWDHVKEFCTRVGLKHVPELWRGKLKSFDPYKYLDTRFHPTYKHTLPLDEGLVDEGVCVRIDTITPFILKAKSPVFREFETKQLDIGEADLESQGGTE